MGKEKKKMYFLLIAGILFVSFNLRPGITSVGPVIGMIRDDIGLSNWSAGILTSLPLIAFALISPVAPQLGKRISNERALCLGLAILAFGIGIRSLFSPFLFLGTWFVGAGIAICNVLLPGVVKEQFPEKVALLTGLYSVAMGIFASVAPGLSIPIAEKLNLGWENALLLWAVPAVIGTFLWLYISKNTRNQEDVNIRVQKEKASQIWRSLLAWQLAFFMGLQSFLFYVTISWLPEMMTAKGIDIETAGWMLSVTQLVGLPFGFLAPVLAGRFKSQWFLVIMLGGFALFGYVGLFIGTASFAALFVYSVFIGMALGGIFPLCLAFIALRARTAGQVAQLSGMVQSIGYLLAAIGPMFIGYLHDISGTWSIPLIAIIIVTIFVIIFGVLSARDRYVA